MSHFSILLHSLFGDKELRYSMKTTAIDGVINVIIP